MSLMRAHELHVLGASLHHDQCNLVTCGSKSGYMNFVFKASPGESVQVRVPQQGIHGMPDAGMFY